MSLPNGTVPIGPQTGSVRLHTTREGVASKVGHDLLIAFNRWTGQLTLDGSDPATAQVQVTIQLDSLEILEGTGGVAALSADDRKDITATALKLLDVASHPEATFTSTRVTPAGSGGTVAGTLTLHGQSGALELEIAETGPSAWRGSGALLQSAFGIKPYKAFFGALRLADRVTIEVALHLAQT